MLNVQFNNSFRIAFPIFVSIMLSSCGLYETSDSTVFVKIKEPDGTVQILSYQSVSNGRYESTMDGINGWRVTIYNDPSDMKLEYTAADGSNCSQGDDEYPLSCTTESGYYIEVF